MKKAIVILLVLAGLLFAEYRVIMQHIHPYVGDNGTVYLELGGRVDEYYAEPARELFK